jgi:hypothetical protein
MNQPARVSRGLFNVPYPLPPKDAPKEPVKLMREIVDKTEGVTGLMTKLTPNTC